MTKISYGPHISKVAGTTTLNAIASAIRGDNTPISKALKTFRDTYQPGQRLTDKEKARLPWFSTSCYFRKKKPEEPGSGRGGEFIEGLSNLIQVDFDLKDNPQLRKGQGALEYLNRFSQDQPPHLALAFLSPNGGLKCVFSVDFAQYIPVPITSDSKRIFREVFCPVLWEYVENLYDLKPDRACNDINRVCYYTHQSKGLYYNPDFTTLVVPPERITQKAVPTSRTTHKNRQGIKSIEDIKSNGQLMDLMGEYSVPFDSSGHDSFNISCPAAEHPGDGDPNCQIGIREDGSVSATCHSHDCSYHSILAGLADLLKIDYKAETPAMKLAKMAGGLGYRFRVNEMYEGVEVQLLDGHWVYCGEGYRFILLEKIRQKYPDAKMSRAKLDESIRILGEFNRVDPWKDWLLALPEWDGKKRLDKLLHRCFKVSPEFPEELVSKAMRCVFIGAIARGFEPGVQHDLVVTLYGSQGSGKSSFWREMVYHSRLFSDNISLSDNYQRRVESLLGHVLIEMSELVGRSRADNTAIKSFISSREDTVRLAYDRSPTRLPRRCVLVGTTNDSECLANDPSGNRRWLVVPVERKTKLNNQPKLVEYIRENREQLWAEALGMYYEGVTSYVDDELRGLQERINRQFTDNSVRHSEIITDMIDNRGFHPPVTIAQICEWAGVENDRSNQRLLGVELKRHGFAKKEMSVNGLRRTVWGTGGKYDILGSPGEPRQGIL